MYRNKYAFLSPFFFQFSSSGASERLPKAFGLIYLLFPVANIHPDMRRKDLMQAVIELLNGDEPAEVHEEAAFTLGNLCVDCTCGISFPELFITNL